MRSCRVRAQRLPVLGFHHLAGWVVWVVLAEAASDPVAPEVKVEPAVEALGGPAALAAQDIKVPVAPADRLRHRACHRLGRNQPFHTLAVPP